MIEAKGPAAHCHNGRGLDSFGHTDARKLVPPALQIFDKVSVVGEELLHQTWCAANFFFQVATDIPLQDVQHWGQYQ